MIRLNDHILAPSRGSAAGWSTRIYTDDSPPVDVWEYLTEVYAVAPLVGIDAALVVAQSVHETTENGILWNSHWWQTRLNPAGIGITGDPEQDKRSRTWVLAADAARSHVGHLLVYALGPSDAGNLWARKVGGAPLTDVDPRYGAYLDAHGNVAKAVTLADLAGTWAVDRQYAEKIAARGNAVFGPSLPNQDQSPGCWWPGDGRA